MAGFTRRTFVTGATAIGVSPIADVARAQQGYPAGLTVKFLVGFPAGGAQDIVGRIIADRLGALWKVPTVVENMPGAGGNLGMDRVAKGPTDGTQICIVPPGLATNQFLYPRLAYDPEKDIIPLGLVATVPNLLCVRKDLPVNSVAELIAYAKANPGKLNYASSGIGTTVHLSAELFKRMAGVDMVHVAYRGSAPALNDLVGQNVDLMFDNITSIIGQARAGAVKPLGITTLTKPSTPCAGVRAGRRTLPGYRDDVMDRLSACAPARPRRSATRSRRTRASSARTRCCGNGWRLWWPRRRRSTRPRTTAYIASERAKWGKLITDIKLKLE